MRDGLLCQRGEKISQTLEYNSLQGGKSINNILKGTTEMW